jgi:hypothetical protein
MILTDTHLILLSAAAQHEQRLLPRPDRISEKAAQALAIKLIRAGLAEETSVRPGQPCWRADDVHPVGLRITGQGLAAIGVEEADEHGSAAPNRKQLTCRPRLLAPAASKPPCSISSGEGRAPPSII